MLLEFGGNKAFRVDQRLLAHIVRWHQLEMGIAHLDIVAKDLVKANFERLDAGAFALAGLQGDHPAPRVADRGDKFVEFGMETQRESSRPSSSCSSSIHGRARGLAQSTQSLRGRGQALRQAGLKGAESQPRSSSRSLGTTPQILAQAQYFIRYRAALAYTPGDAFQVAEYPAST